MRGRPKEELFLSACCRLRHHRLIVRGDRAVSEKPQRSFFMKLSILIMGVVSLLAFTYAILGANGYLELRRKHENNRKLSQQIEQVRQQNQRILQEIKALKTDPKSIEKIAREELGMVRPGEVKITPNAGAGESSNLPDTKKPHAE
jgi:cell division protein FtsB